MRDNERIVARVEEKNGSRRYQVQYAGYDDPEEYRWYDEADLRAMGSDTIKMLDDFDAAEDRREVQGRIAARSDGAGVRKSDRLQGKQGRRVVFKGG